MAGQVRKKNYSFDDETYKIAYAKCKNYFSVRLHYSGELVGNPNFSYEGGKVELFDYGDADTFELENVKFIDVYFLKPGNTDLLLDMEDEYGNIKLSDWSTKILKAKVDERAKLSAERGSVGVVEFNFEDGNNDSDSDTGNVEEKGENVENDENEWSDSDTEYEVAEVERDEEDNDGSDSEYDDVNDVLYGKEQDNFDYGDLGGSDSILSEVFLEKVEEEFVMLEEEQLVEDQINNRKGKQPMLGIFNATKIDDTSEPNRAATGKKKKYKGPYVRYGIQFRERRLVGWVLTTSDDSKDASYKNLDDSDFDSSNTTSESEQDMSTMPGPSPKTLVAQHANKEAPQNSRKKKQHSCSQSIPSKTRKKSRFNQSQTEAAPTTSSQPIPKASTNTSRKTKSALKRMSQGD
ncbi:hypothetical protein LIER_39457 [Lithospermum erythrorhizon]|uniref:Uncharacterized protein n=1 Tax=Lithospermum erythrorhizon TaxID=34254 RepID=A0AAV3QF17_LITER